MTKTVLITGASGKLGSAIAQHLATLGWSMVLTSRDPERCAVALDLKSQDSTDTLAARIAELNVRVTHVVSNARSLETLAVGEDGVSQVQPFMDELSIDVVSPYRMLMAFSRDQSHDLRAVVTIGSQYGQVGPTSCQSRAASHDARTCSASSPAGSGKLRGLRWFRRSRRRSISGAVRPSRSLGPNAD